LRITIARREEEEDDLTSSDRRRLARLRNDAGKVVLRERPV
jgi:hypothetical protein